ncbi:MAG: HAMP domain-containing protein, partial [Pseudothermotoga sp.]
MKTLRGKMLMLILMPIIALIVAVAFIAYFQVSSAVTSNVEEMAFEVANKASDIVNEWINGLVKEVEWLAGTNAVNNALKSGNWDDLMKNYLPPPLKQKPYFEMAFIAYPDGNAPTTLGSVANVADRDYFIKIIKQGQDLAISDALISKVTGKPIFVVAAAVKDENNKTIGFFGTTVLLDTISQIASNIKIGKAGYGWVVDSTGLILAHPNKEVVMKLNITQASKEGYKNVEEIAQKMLSGKEGFGKFIQPDGTVDYAFYAPIDTVKGWSFAVSVPEKQVLLQVNNLLVIIIIVFAILIAIAAVLILFVSSSISKPIKVLSQRATEFGKGDLTVTFEAKGKDE